MDLVNGRGKSEISYSGIEKAFDTAGVLTPIMLANGKDLHNQLYDIAVFSMPVARAAQNAAITSIYKLGQRHSVFKAISHHRFTTTCGRFTKQIGVCLCRKNREVIGLVIRNLFLPIIFI